MKVGISMLPGMATAAMFATLFLSTHAFAGSVMVGGYSPVDSRTPDITGAARFALAARNQMPDTRALKLVAIRKAEQQVVAGMNYRLCLSVRNKGKAYRVQAIVYNDLSGTMHLTEWLPGGC